MYFMMKDGNDTVTDIEVVEGDRVYSSAYGFFKEWAELSGPEKEGFIEIRDTLTKTFKKMEKRYLCYGGPAEGTVPREIEEALNNNSFQTGLTIAGKTTEESVTK